MDTELLKTFLEVQKTRHFGKAAENLYLTQSAISFRIRQLEQNLGVALFTRYRNNIQLTAAGELLLPHASAVLSAIGAAKEQIQQQRQLQQAKKVLLSAELNALLDERCWEELFPTGPHWQVDALPAHWLSRQDFSHIDAVIAMGNPFVAHPLTETVFLGALEFWPVCHSSGQMTSEATLTLAGHLPRLGTQPLMFSSADPDAILQRVLTHQACAYLPASMLQRLLATEQLRLLDAAYVRFPVYAYSLPNASWPLQWRKLLLQQQILQPSL